MDIPLPVLHNYPSFSSAFGQSIADVVGRSRKSQAQKILKAFDESTIQAQTYVTKATEYITKANELMAKSHHECFSAIQQLLVDAHSDRQARNERRRGARKKNERAAAGTSFFAISVFPNCNYH
jgi:predicted RNase H-like nuclease